MLGAMLAKNGFKTILVDGDAQMRCVAFRCRALYLCVALALHPSLGS
jgi:hypothetical protein